MNKIRFRRSYYNYSDKFERFMFWGPIESGFENPGSISQCTWRVDEQFIGKQDMNGFDIFEGDICEILYTDWPSNTDPNILLDDYLTSISHRGVIVFDAPTFAINLIDRYGEFSPHSLNYGQHGRIKIIGNIHLTPGLIPVIQ